MLISPLLNSHLGLTILVIYQIYAYLGMAISEW